MVERKRSYKMGHRNTKKISNQTPGRMSKNRWAWCRVYFGQFMIWADYFVDEEENQTDEVKDIRLTYPIPNRKPVSWNLTALTEEELKAVKEIFDVAFALALPIVQERDKEAQIAYEQGDDTHSRIYRPLPQLVYRSGTVREHGQSVLDRLEDDARVLSDSVNSDDSIRSDVDELAESDEEVSSPEDDGETTD